MFNPIKPARLHVSSAVKLWSAAAAFALGLPGAAACSSSTVDPAVAGAPPTGNPTGGSPASGGARAGGSTSSGAAAPAGGVATGGSAGSVATGGALGSGGASTGGAAGSSAGGVSTGGMVAAGGGDSGADPCGMPPTHELNVMAAVGEHNHNGAGLDNRAKKMLGKLVIDYGVAGGGYIGFLAKRGYHSIGAPGFPSCPAPDLQGDRTRVGKCRIGEIQTTEKNIENKLADLQNQYPEEDWGYFLDASGKLRWSDVAVTGFSHGATTAAINARVYACLWRAVSRSGPRDNTCGTGPCSAPVSTPSYNAACTDDKVAEWLDQPSKTPMDRFYGITGMTDGQCGDIMFNMHRTKYLGEPLIINAANADPSTTHQYFVQGEGHSGFFDNGSATLALEIAFGIPPENRSPTF